MEGATELRGDLFRVMVQVGFVEEVGGSRWRGGQEWHPGKQQQPPRGPAP